MMFDRRTAHRLLESDLPHIEWKVLSSWQPVDYIKEPVSEGRLDVTFNVHRVIQSITSTGTQ